MKKRSNIEQITVDDWDNLLANINDLVADWPAYIFRGQASSDWLLESTLSRALKRIKYTDKEELVKEHLERFKLKIRGRRGKNPRQLSENELWALGQHYGLYTPLLDWSRSPYVGLFFALTDVNKSPTGQRTLWALHSTDSDTITKFYKNKESNSKRYLELVDPILDENERLVNQNGLFTKTPLTTDIEDLITRGPNIEWVTLYKINFPDGLRDEGIAYLNLMNINYASLYPDLSGSSLDTNLKLEQTDYLDGKQALEWEDQKGKYK
jgi:hypothetical protein